MSHDVYICYDTNDEKYGEAVSGLLEDNNISTWIKSRDMSKEYADLTWTKSDSSNEAASKITQAIANSKCFLLVYSKNSKDSNYIINETDIAFSKEIPILLFKIDDSTIEKDLEFILISKRKVLSFPDTRKQLKLLVNETTKKIKRPIDNPKIGSKYVRTFEKTNPKRKENIFLKLVMAAVPIAIALVLIYIFVMVPAGQHTTDDGIFTMNITGVEISESNGMYSYKVLGECNNMPENSSRYFYKLKFFDKNDYMVHEVNSTADEFKFGQLGNFKIEENNVTHIEFRLVDMKGNELSNQDYVIE